MGRSETFWTQASDYLVAHQPERPVLFFSAPKLQATAAEFLAGFPGQVTYAVKANPSTEVISNLTTAGLRAFDVASPAEILAIRDLQPKAQLHYNNPVRSEAEIQLAVRHDVYSYAIESDSELEKLAKFVAPAGHEVAVRFKLDVGGAKYNFGSKFGATPDKAANLLARVARMGFIPALTFHPGTQCTDAQAWVRYIEEAAEIAARAGVTIARLNVGGGFPAHRSGTAPQKSQIFAAIEAATRASFAPQMPKLVSEPGRAMVAESYALAVRVKAIRDGRDIFLNDGIYGALAELPLLGHLSRIEVLSAEGARRAGPLVERPVFGPTCDSVDRLPDGIELPCDMIEGDYLLIQGVGAYSTVTNTRFNGYGDYHVVDAVEFS